MLQLLLLLPMLQLMLADLEVLWPTVQQLLHVR
jgi:hypothetical protein